MSCPIYFIFSIFCKISLSQYWIVGCRLKWPARIFANKNHFTMPIASTSFCTHQKIATIFFIYMRAFYPYRSLCDIHSPIYYYFICTRNHSIVFYIIFPLFNNPVTRIQFFAMIWSIIMY